jgi:hypothetical protein
MVDWIIRLTALAVATVAAANMARGAWLLVRLGLHVNARYRHLGRHLWLPLWRRPGDAREWLAMWWAILTSADPMIAAVRHDGRVVAARHVQLLVMSDAWAMAVTILLPRLA